jgi:hypothetical protein
MMTDILDICEAQLGQHEASDGSTKYGKWLDQQAGTRVYAKADWCGASLLWCIAQLGPEYSAAAGGVDKDFAYVQSWYDWMRAHGRTSRTAKARRLVWYDWAGTPDGANHIGLIKSVSGSTMKVYEGNHNNRFELATRHIDSQVMGFGEWWSHVEQPTVVSAGGGDWFIDS